MNTTKKTNHRSHILTLILTLMLLAWGNSAWAQTWSAPAEAPAAGATLVDNDDLTVTTVFATTAESNYQHDYGDYAFTNSIQVRVDAAPTSETPTGTNKATTTPLVVSVKKPGTLTLYFRRQCDDGTKDGTSYTAGNSKDILVVDQASATTKLNGVISGGTAADNDYCKEIFSLEAGHTYTVWARGTTVRLNGFNYVASTPDPEPQSLYDATVTNVEQLKTALAAANGTSTQRYKIFVKNGTYNLGTAYDTAVKNYTTLIGESRDGVIIENHPTTEGIWTSATLRTQSNVVMQNLTLHSIVELNNGAERGTSLYDDGSNNVYKNIRLLGRQDTYYSSDYANSYFEDCEIHGTVDFICGGGNAWFEHCDILIEDRASAVIVAPRSGATNYQGYFLNNCTIDNAEGANMNNKYYLGRGWEGHPKSVFANCTYNISPKTVDGYNRTDWAHGAKTDADDNSGMIKQDAALDNASTTMGTVATAVQPLAAPATISLEGNTLSWAAVAGASAYAVYRDNTLLTITSETSFDVSSVASAKSRGMMKASGSGENYSVAAISNEGIVGEAKLLNEPEPEPEPTEFEERTATWDWKNKIPASITEVNIQGKKGTVASNIAGVELDVDATVTDGKLAYVAGEGYAQMNAGTIVKIPIRHAGDIVTVSIYYGEGYATINGVAMTSKVQNYTANDTDAENGYVILGATGTTYPDIISVKQIAYSLKPTLADVTESTTWDWSKVTSVTTSALYANNGIQLTESTAIKITDEVVLSTYSPDHITFASGFNADAIAFQGEYPSRKNMAQNGILHFHTTVPGTVKVDFSDTGASASATAFKRYLNVNGVNTEYWTSRPTAGAGSNDRKESGEIEVDAGDVYIKAMKEDGTTPTAVCFYKVIFTAKEDEPEPASSFKDFEILVDNSANSLLTETEKETQWTSFEFGISVDNEGNVTRVDKNSPSSIATISGKSHSEHGSNNLKVVVPVDGPVKISIGHCTYSEKTITVKNSDDVMVMSATPTNECWKDNHSRVSELIYDGEATTLTISGMDYCPYFKIERYTPPTYTDKVLYKTKFQDWDAVASSTTETQVAKRTKDGQDLTFSLMETQIAPNGTKDGFTNDCITRGYAMAAKTATPYIKTTTLASVYKVKFVHAATGTNRGWGLKVKGVGDADWVTVSDAYCAQNGTEVEVVVDRKNVQLWFYNLNSGHNAYMTSLEIYDRVEKTPREFTDFKIDFRTETPTIVLPEDHNLPVGVVLNKGTYHTNQHGTQNATITVPVDGPVKFTIGGCQYTNKATVSIGGGTAKDIDTKSPGCDDKGVGTYTKYATYIYNSMTPATLTFNLGSYCPYFFAEACEFIPDVNITYFDTDGVTSLGSETVPGNSPLAYGYETEHVNVPDGSKFRGWFEGPNATDLKVADGTVLTEDIELYARVTEIEDLIKNPQYEYDLTKKYFYLEDHELLTIENGKYHNDHGWTFDEGSNVSVEVPGNVRLTLTLCQYSAEGNVQITDASGNKIGKPFNAKADKDKDEVVIDYVGGPTTLSFSMPKGSYLHKLVVKNASYPSVVFINRYPKTLLGKVPDDIIAAPGTHKVKIPENTTLYREGWTLLRWEDDNKKPFEFNHEYVVDVATNLYPVIEKSVPVTETNSVLDATWPFDLLDGAPNICLHNKNEDANVMTYTKQVQVNGTPVDVPLIIDAANGKADNTDKRVNALDDGAGHEAHGGQLNDGTILTVPAVYGMIVTLNASNKIDTDSRYNNNQTHFGSEDTDAKIELYDAKGGAELGLTPTITNNGKSISFTYTGDATSLDLLLKKTGSSTTWGFFKDITVSYPVLPNVVAINVINIEEAQKLPGEKVDGADKNAGHVAIKTITSAGTHTNTGDRYKVDDVVTITATPDYGYEVSGFRKQGGEAITPVTDGSNGVKSVDFTVVDGITNIEVLYTRKTVHKVTVMTANKELGTVDIEPKYDNFYTKNAETGVVESYYTEGTSVTATAEGAAGYVIKSWNEDTTEGKELGVNNAYAYTVTTVDKTFVASFKQGEIGSVVFDISVTTPNGQNVDGYDDPAANYQNCKSVQPAALNNVRSFTIPTNFTFFKNNGTEFGYTLKYWKDASGNRYELGKVYSFTTKDQTLTLTPVFEYNPASQLNRLNNPIIHYEFGTGVKTYTDKTESFIKPGTIVGEKKVAAQHVNFGRNENFFWTSQVYTEVLDQGLERAHTRDVAMWVNTGKNGFFRNGDMDEWAALGPGTTLWFASGAGTKVSLMTYAPITTTTIDGIVPELDTEDPRCDVKNHKYVYSLVVDNPTLRIPIVIGDDYSYYQWLETATLAANLVNLHADVDDDVRGVVTSIGTESAYGASELADGGYAFHQGDRVKLSFERDFGFEFLKITDPDKIVNNEPLAVLEMRSDGKVNMVKFGDSAETATEVVEPSGEGKWGTFVLDDPATPVDESAHNTVFTLKKTEPTDKEKAEGKRTRYEVEFNITTHRNLQICFEEKKTYYITFNAGQLASGSAPAAVWAEAGDKYVIPHNNTLYYEGNTLDYWYDEAGNHYNIGQEYTAPSNDLRLFPHFSPNAFSLLDAEGTATWELATKNGAPTIAFERSKGILVTQLYNNDKSKWIDLKVDLDASDHLDAEGNTVVVDGRAKAGKFNNTAYDDRCQINQYSVITFPSSTGCVVSLNATGDVSSTTVAGKNKDDDGYKLTNTSFSVTYDGNDANQQVVFNQSNIYAQNFSVKYKASTTKKPSLETLSVGSTALTDAQLTELKTNKTLTVTVNPFDNNEQIPAITGTATNSGFVKATQATVEMTDPQSTVTVWTKADNGFLMETYTIKFNYGKPTSAPTFVKYIVNGKKSTTPTSTFNDVPLSGVVKVEFSRTMQSTTIPTANQSLTTDTHSAERGKVLEFRYWNLPAGGTTTLSIPASSGLFKDIYGVNLAQDLQLTLSVQAASDIYEHRTFDYIVGKDGDIDNAITQANAATGTDRYYVFIPDGEYKLTGNEKITPTMSSDGMAPADNDGVNRNDLLGKAIDNGKTQITRANVSLIGQSREGVTVYNKPTIEGISYTSTIHTAGTATDFYVEDMTLEDRFDYKTSIAKQEKSPAARGVVFQDGANRSVMKNVALKSWQDTYWSSGSDGDYRGYFEGCQLWGVVDWICGNGDIWFEKCDMVIRDRSGNNLAAPRTSRQQQWGYVLNQCNIIKEPDVTISELADKSWTLARPWGSGATNSPACTFLSNKIEIQPRQSGWGTMGSEMILRFHEYNTTDLNGNPVSLGTRSLAACSPAAGSDDCVLNKAQASNYTVRNALGGADAFDPQTLTKQIDAASGGVKDMNTYAWEDNIEINDDLLEWKNETMALCYFIFKKNGDKWEYIANVAQKEGEEYTSFNLYEHGGGLYCVRAANQRGGLGAATKEVNYVPSTAITLELKELKEGTPQYEQYRGHGWSTICLPFNSKVPDGLTVYAANGKAEFDKAVIADNYQLYLKSVDVLNGTDADGKNYGYVVYGPVGTYEFRSSSKTSDVITILSGNPTSESIDRGNNNCYVMSNKTTYGLGFYKYTGATLAANRAWLPINMVDMNSQTDASKAITFFIVNDDDVTTAITTVDRVGDDAIYNLHGQRIQRSQMRRGGVYIINGVKQMYRGK